MLDILPQGNIKNVIFFKNTSKFYPSKCLFRKFKKI